MPTAGDVWCGAQVRGRALKKEEQEQVDIAQRVLDVLKSDKDVRCVCAIHTRPVTHTILADLPIGLNASASYTLHWTQSWSMCVPWLCPDCCLRCRCTVQCSAGLPKIFPACPHNVAPQILHCPWPLGLTSIRIEL